MSAPAAHPYRASELETLPTPPDTLVYAPADRPRRDEAVRRAAGVVWLGGAASLGAAAFVDAAVGALSFAAVAAAAYGVWKRTRTSGRIVLRVVEGRLVSKCADAPSVSIALSQIRNIRLETKTIEKLQTDRTLGAFIVSRSVRPALDVSRIVIVPSKTWGAPFALTDEYEANFEAVEWLGKLRRFLRAHGWIPADERVER